jgi:hypothetical protein
MLELGRQFTRARGESALFVGVDRGDFALGHKVYYDWNSL